MLTFLPRNKFVIFLEIPIFFIYPEFARNKFVIYLDISLLIPGIAKFIIYNIDYVIMWNQ